MENTLKAKSYRLHILLEEAATITVGKLGRFTIPQGKYIYTGSAKKNIAARVARHLSASKKIRWHIDYLLAHPQAKIVSVELLKIGECEANQNLKGQIPIPRFGATDCMSGCGSHLKYVGEMPPYKMDISAD